MKYKVGCKNMGLHQARAAVCAGRRLSFHCQPRQWWQTPARARSRRYIHKKRLHVAAVDTKQSTMDQQQWRGISSQSASPALDHHNSSEMQSPEATRRASVHASTRTPQTYNKRRSQDHEQRMEQRTSFSMLMLCAWGASGSNPGTLRFGSSFPVHTHTHAHAHARAHTNNTHFGPIGNQRPNVYRLCPS
mgnify:CR=1 FL=1